MPADPASHEEPFKDRGAPGDTGGVSAILPSDPLQRLEVELGEQNGAQSGDERLYREAQGLVEEAWSVLTECLGIRDGLLEACQEVEQAMGNMQRRIGALSVALDAEAQGSEPAATPRTLAGPTNGSSRR